LERKGRGNLRNVGSDRGADSRFAIRRTGWGCARTSDFAQLVASGINATEAYIAVGYSRRGAHASAHRLQLNSTVGSRLAELRGAVLERTLEKAAVDRAWIIERLRSNVERSRQVEPIVDREGEATGQYRFDVTGANKALELLGRSIGLFVDRGEYDIIDGGRPAEEQRRRLAVLSDEELKKLEELLEKMDAGTEAGKPGGL
jgi:phage terminase small subunit